MPCQDGLLQGGAIGQLAASIVERRGLSGVDIDFESALIASPFQPSRFTACAAGILDLSGRETIGEGDGAISPGASPPGHRVLIHLVVINKL